MVDFLLCKYPTISAKMHPALQTSTAVEYNFEPKSISGALYHKVTTSWVKILTGTPNDLAKPKSASFKHPSWSIKTFCGFKSLCNILLT